VREDEFHEWMMAWARFGRRERVFKFLENKKSEFEVG